MSATDLDAVAAAIASRRYQYTDEFELHEGIAIALVEAGQAFTREVALSVRDRIDFLVGKIGVEVKTQGSVSRVATQLLRYAASPRVDGLILVTTRLQLDRFPAELAGKPLRVVALPRALR